MTIIFIAFKKSQVHFSCTKICQYLVKEQKTYFFVMIKTTKRRKYCSINTDHDTSFGWSDLDKN